MYKQHPPRWQHLRQMLQMGKVSSSHKQRVGDDETEEQIFHQKKHFRKKATELVANEETSSMQPSIKEFTRIDGNNTSSSLIGIKANAWIRVEQDADSSLKNLKLKKLSQPHDDVLLTKDRQLKHYKANENRNILTYGLLFPKYYGKTGSVKNYPNLPPKKLVSEVLRSQYG